ncbi:protein-export chaperone SecB [Ralstonia pseudosolanacearum]|uniref:protein-export chaperone SecB n=1 Tax=Ralstonia pseudosolanacearum TaxID=1310165 RepID=UPI0018CFF274|nr:protein-export chaperone SecB [Ralstonia pseudosolanacearum]
MADNSGKTGGGKPWPLHAIQLVALRVLTLQLQANVEVDRAIRPEAFVLETAHSEYDPEDSSIEVKLRVRVGSIEADENASPSPYSLEVELIGVFKVDAAKFPMEHIEHWAQNNAPMVLYPYTREHTTSMAIRGGFEPVLLPLLEMPSFKVVAPGADAIAQA